MGDCPPILLYKSFYLSRGKKRDASSYRGSKPVFPEGQVTIRGNALPDLPYRKAEFDRAANLTQNTRQRQMLFERAREAELQR